ADGIRDDLVTGVQTCALPIWAADDAAVRAYMLAEGASDRNRAVRACHLAVRALGAYGAATAAASPAALVWLERADQWAEAGSVRSEERRVGQEGRRWVGRRDW